MERIADLLQTVVLGAPASRYLAAIGIVIAGWIAAWIVERIVHAAAKRLPDTSVRFAVIDAAAEPIGWAPKVVALWLGIDLFPLGTLGETLTQRSVVDRVFLGATIAVAMWYALRLTDRVTALWELRAQKTESTFDDQLVPIARTSTKVFLVIVGAVTVLQNLGYSVGSLLAGVGLGGAALALASKDTVANLFGSLVIFIDRPFQIGDWIEIGAVEGTVEEVGLRVTRIRTFANSLITIPNAQLTTTAINNWSRMKKRRIKLSVSVTYATTPEQLERAVTAIREIIARDERMEPSFYLVNFHEFGPHSLDIFVYCFTRTTNWLEYMQVRQEFLLAVMHALRGLGVEFAFPTQTIHLAPGSAAAASGGSAPHPSGFPSAMDRQAPL